MCIIIDVNTFPAVFDDKNRQHNKFRPILCWITDGRGKIVLGGTTYRNELRKLKKFISLMSQLEKAGKLAPVNDREVDRVESRLRKLSICRGFDDCHIVAIVIVSSCRLVCSLDKSLHSYLKNKQLYPNNCKRPYIFVGHTSNHSLLCDENIAAICC